MGLDGLTLIAAGGFMLGICSLVLLAAWTQIRAPALLWWGTADIVNAIGISVLAFGLGSGDVLALAVGGILSAFSAALLWAGMRSFSGRRQNYPLIVVGTVLYVATGALVPAGDGPVVIAAAVGFGLWFAYLAAACFELWRGRGEALLARWPLIGFFGLHAFVFAGGIIDALTGRLPASVIPPLSSWFSIIQFETIIFAAGTSVFMVLLIKERSERQYIIAGRQDFLTGIANRGALLEGGERLLQRCRNDGRSFSLIIFDLDHFKWVNDTFGHAIGDDVIRLFAKTTRSVVRPTDLFGRYGGEEFVIMLPNATIEAAYVIADRIRYGFAAASVMVADAPLKVTVSAGVAAAASATDTLDAIMLAADRCLYRAKELGRNRVERPAKQPETDVAENVIRIA